jgi:hypothetical protein
MKFLIAFLMLFPFIAKADFVEVDAGFGQGTKPFYGADYEFVTGLQYTDVSLTGNSDYVQPYISAGLQFEHFNFGLGAGVSVSNFSGGAFNGQLGVGPEFGYMHDISKLMYLKVNNTYLGYPSGQFNFTSILSIGFNL